MIQQPLQKQPEVDPKHHTQPNIYFEQKYPLMLAGQWTIVKAKYWSQVKIPKKVNRFRLIFNIQIGELLNQERLFLQLPFTKAQSPIFAQKIENRKYFWGL